MQVSEGKALAVGPMTWEFWEPGRWAWFDVDKVHEIRNTGTVPLEYHRGRSPRARRFASRVDPVRDTRFESSVSLMKP